ncbi:MAG: Mth938-like domain-containing protein [bacterium]
MKFSQDLNQATYRITAQENHRIRVNDQWQTQSFIITPNALVEDWSVPNIQSLQANDCMTLLAHQPEVVILGTGQQQYFPEPSILKQFIQQNIGVEIMSTSAACRTFNILVGEGRHVVAGIIVD